MLTVKSLTGETYTAVASLNRNRRVNGERDISLSFLWNEINAEFIEDIETGWKVQFQGDWYHLFSPQEDKDGNKSFQAVLDFFHYFNGIWHVDEAQNRSMTIQNSILPLFIGKDYTVNIIDNFYANTMSYSKQQTSTERFLYFIGRHNAEFNIPIGTQTVQIRNRIGVRRSDIIIHEDDNLIDLNINTDTSSFCTAIKGYYDFQEVDEDSTDKVPTKTYDYISPMADKYGLYWGQPIHDERYSTLEGIQEACREKQESTFKMSFELRASLFDTPLNEGDEIRLVYPSKGINTYVRVVEISEEFDEELDLIDASYTFGNENISAQYRKVQYDAIADLGDILMGKKPIPFSVLPSAVRQATEVINAGDRTQFYYRANGIYGYHLDNPLGVTRYNANGIGFSQDGGETYENAMTYLGIVATAITSGTINTNNVTIYGSEGYNRIEITGDSIKVWDSRDPDVYTEMTRGRIHANKGALSVRGADGRQVIVDGIMRGTRVANIIQFNSSEEVEFNGMNWLYQSADVMRFYYLSDIYNGQYLDIICAVNMPTSSPTQTARVDVRAVTYEGTVVGATNVEVDKSNIDSEIVRLRLDMQDLFNSVVDYREVNLYVEAQTTENTNGLIAFRVNRGEWHG